MNRRSTILVRKTVGKPIADTPNTFTFIVPENLGISERAELVSGFGNWLLDNSKKLKPGAFYQLIAMGVAPISYLKSSDTEKG
jgi:hypothetical protein